MATTPALAYSSDPEDKPAMEALRQSQKELEDALERRKAPLFDPTLLAMAQGFLAPTKSGRFGENLGIVAQLVGPAQESEEKRAIENAKIRAELAKERLLMSQQLKGEQMFQNIMRRQRPGAEDVVSGPAAAVAAGVEPTPGVAPAGVPAPTATKEASFFTPRFTEEEYILLRKYKPDLAEALERGEKISLDRLKAALDVIGAQPGFLYNRLTKEVTPIVSPGQADVDIRFPETMEGKAGQVFKGSVEDAIALRNARNAGDYSAIERIYKKLAYGVPAPGAAAAGQPPVRASSVQESEINAQRQKDLSSEFAKSEAKATAALLDNDSYNRETSYTAARVIQNAATNPQLFGLLRDPGIGNALASFIKDRGEQNQYAITKENLQDFLIKLKFDTTKLDMVNLAKMASDLARMHFGMRKAYFSGTGQGAVSDREDMGLAKIAGSVSDPAAALIYTAQLTGRRAQFDVDVANALRKERMEKGKNYTLEDFKTDPKSSYRRLLTEYENWLTKQFNLPPGITPETRSSQFSDTQVIPPPR